MLYPLSYEGLSGESNRRSAIPVYSLSAALTMSDSDASI